MPEIRAYRTNGAQQPFARADSRRECIGVEFSRMAGATSPNLAEKYIAVSPKGIHISIPKELYVALDDFMKTRKCPGSITIQFRDGVILGMESLAKKTYRR